LTNPAYPMGPYRFRNREYLIGTYRTIRDPVVSACPLCTESGSKFRAFVTPHELMVLLET
jgi:acetoacetate decarboxylase